ncbi:3-keto-disaccharide hydrolase [Zunongwangia sp. HGR-M22]|uniref:3-keto-disaccharide hydrolase n=1 Tax=Zunongwangia sp. HGR-M22 TaxID=3015168 RepID=UPI0022DDB685|nr:DUF1080 domain-containing protein [Zunongwangia sp. HGR-M22]WBL26711.1 DUF1080 domain-containing protein [Zunongwangia sp. HGR-M22]
MRISGLIMCLSIITLGACKNNNEKEQKNGVKASAITNDFESDTADLNDSKQWINLLDEEHQHHWRGYNSTEKKLPQGWSIKDGELYSSGEGADIGGDIVFASKEFDNFELQLEWKLSKGGNSGIFYHILEADAYKAPYYTAPEYQIIDQVGFPQKLEPWQSIGADYAMYNPKFEEKDLKKTGEWNTSTIRFTANEVTYWLNGKKTLSFRPWTEDWKRRKSEGKWKNYPHYGQSKTGLIGLQDHGSEIWFRNIRIKEL